MKSWNEIRKAATAFSKRWKNAYDEKSQAQSFLKEFFAVFGVEEGGKPAAKAGGVKGAGLERMELHAAVAADADGIAGKPLRHGLPAVGNPDGMALRFQSLRKIRTDPSGAANAADRIDHQNLHGSNPLTQNQIYQHHVS